MCCSSWDTVSLSPRMSSLSVTNELELALYYSLEFNSGLLSSLIVLVLQSLYQLAGRREERRELHWAGPRCFLWNVSFGFDKM